MRQWCAVIWVLGTACGRYGFDASDSSDSVTAVYAAAVLADRPIAYFRFNETTGTVARSVVGSVQGTYEGTFGFGAAGAVGDGDPSITFDGSTTRIVVGDVFRFANRAPYSFEVWIKPAELGSTRFIVDRRTSTGNREGYTMYVGETYFLFSRTTNGSEFGYVSADPPALDVWTHAVVTFDGSKQAMYVDSVLVQVNLGDAANPIGDAAGAFTIGDMSPGQFFKFKGQMDELAVYDRALAPETVKAHFDAARR